MQWAAKILLLTTAQPSTNPRLVKEAEALSEAGYWVKVLYCYRADWALKADREILKRARWEHQLIGGTPQHHKVQYNWTRLRRRLFQELPFLPKAVEKSSCQAYDELLRAARKEKADLYIAHNPGALPIAARAAKSLGKPYAFDAEDFHIGELPLNHPQSQKIRDLEKKYLPGTTYLSAASPMIAQAYTREYDLSADITPIHNVFSLRLQPAFRPRVAQAPLRLFWFSQTLGRDRGIQDVLQSLALLSDIPIEVGLLGLCSESDRAYFRSFFSAPCHKLEFLNLCPEEELIKTSSTYDIGLALERNTPPNRNLCLTNKLFTYLLAGNAVLVSETEAQKAFLDTYSQVGQPYPIGDTQAVVQILRRYWENPRILEDQRRAAWQLVKDKLNWENEKIKFLSLVEEVL